MENKIKDLLIVGAGPVGLYAWSCAGLMGLSGYIVEAHDLVGGQPIELYPQKKLYDIPGTQEIKTEVFIEQLYNQGKTNGQDIELILGTSTTNITDNEDFYTVSLSNKEEISVKTILITCGNGSFTPRKIDLKVFPDNLSYKVKSIADFRNKNIVILGGGDSAVDWANFFAENEISKSVSIIHRRPEYRAKDSSIEKMNLMEKKIVQYRPYILKDFVMNGNIAEKVIIQNEINGEIAEIATDIILVQYGAAVGRSQINQWPLSFAKNGKILTNIGTYTNMRNVFAAGNAAFHENKYYNMTSGFGEAVTALYNITRAIKGEKYNPGYIGQNKSA